MSTNKTPLQNFMTKVQVQPNGCWHWTGYISPDGYGKFGLNGKVTIASRASWILHGRQVVPKMDIDHTCHDPKTCRGGFSCIHRRCVNPDHLRAVTRAENCSTSRANLGAFMQNLHRSKTHCPRGHEYDLDNTYLYHGRRQCRKCAALSMQRRTKEHLKHKQHAIAEQQDELKRCPFCGGIATIINLPDAYAMGGIAVECSSCQASTKICFNLKEDPRTFVSLWWNRRVDLYPHTNGTE